MLLSNSGKAFLKGERLSHAFSSVIGQMAGMYAKDGQAFFSNKSGCWEWQGGNRRANQQKAHASNRKKEKKQKLCELGRNQKHNTTTNAVNTSWDTGAHPQLTGLQRVYRRMHLSHSRVVPLPGVRTSARDYQLRPKESRLALQALYRVHAVSVCREGAITETHTREK